jgi:hypothetical protein
MRRHASVAGVILVALLVLGPVDAAQDSGASTFEQLSSSFEAMAQDSRQLTSRKDFVQMSDADAAAATARIASALKELRARFRPASLDPDGIVLFRCYESEGARAVRLDEGLLRISA